MRKHAAAIFALCLLPALGACSAPTGSEDVGTTRQALSAGPTFFVKNTSRYKDTGGHPATGRAGNATLQVRALLGKDGNTDVDVTTGQLDSSAAAPGALAKVQLKTYDGSGNAVYVRNYNAGFPSGATRITLSDLVHRQQIQAQANVRGIDPRTDVVTVDTDVKLRPDLDVDRIVAPSHVNVGTDLTISAVVRELNADVGASGDCVLSIDGAAVDQAEGIFVDAGGAVTCRFQHKFTSVGSHTIRVEVSGVVPADYDPSNNSKTAAIEVTQSAPVYYWSGVYDVNYDSSDSVDLYITQTSTPDYHRDENSHGWYRGEGLWAFSPAPMSALPDSGTFSSKTGSTDLGTATFTYPWRRSYSWGSNTMSYGWDFSNYTWSYFWTWSWNGQGWSWFGVWRDAGDVTYHSDGFCMLNDWRCGGSYSWNRDSHDTFGNQTRIGADAPYSQHFVLQAAGSSLFDLSPTMTVRPVSWEWSQPYSCYYNWYGWIARYCYGYDYSAHGVSGGSFGQQ